MKLNLAVLQRDDTKRQHRGHDPDTPPRVLVGEVHAALHVLETTSRLEAKSEVVSRSRGEIGRGGGI